MNEELIEAARALACELEQNNLVTHLERSALAQCACYVNKRESDYLVTRLDARTYRAFVFSTEARAHEVLLAYDYETLAEAREYVDFQLCIDNSDEDDIERALADLHNGAALDDLDGAALRAFIDKNGASYCTQDLIEQHTFTLYAQTVLATRALLADVNDSHAQERCKSLHIRLDETLRALH